MYANEIKFPKHVAPIWQSRIIDAVQHVTWNGEGFSTISKLRIPQNWPAKGSVRFTRNADETRFALRMNKTKFVCKPV